MTDHVCKCTWAQSPHATWGDCIRAKGIQVGDLMGRNRNRQLDKSLDNYEAARRQGIQPKTTSARDVRKAVELSDDAGVPFRDNLC